MAPIRPGSPGPAPLGPSTTTTSHLASSTSRGKEVSASRQPNLRTVPVGRRHTGLDLARRSIAHASPAGSGYLARWTAAELLGPRPTSTPRVLSASSALSVTKAVAAPYPELTAASARSCGERPNTSSLLGVRAATTERSSANSLALRPSVAAVPLPTPWRQRHHRRLFLALARGGWSSSAPMTSTTAPSTCSTACSRAPASACPRTWTPSSSRQGAVASSSSGGKQRQRAAAAEAHTHRLRELSIECPTRI